MPSRYQWYLLGIYSFVAVFGWSAPFSWNGKTWFWFFFHTTSHNKSTITVQGLHIRSCGQAAPIHMTSVSFKGPWKPEQEPKGHQKEPNGHKYAPVTTKDKGGPRKCGTSFLEWPHKAPRGYQRAQVDSKGCPKSTKARNMYPEGTKWTPRPRQKTPKAIQKKQRSARKNQDAFRCNLQAQADTPNGPRCWS